MAIKGKSNHGPNPIHHSEKDLAVNAEKVGGERGIKGSGISSALDIKGHVDETVHLALDQVQQQAETLQSLTQGSGSPESNAIHTGESVTSHAVTNTERVTRNTVGSGIKTGLDLHEKALEDAGKVDGLKTSHNIRMANAAVQDAGAQAAKAVSNAIHTASNLTNSDRSAEENVSRTIMDAGTQTAETAGGTAKDSLHRAVREKIHEDFQDHRLAKAQERDALSEEHAADTLAGSSTVPGAELALEGSEPVEAAAAEVPAEKNGISVKAEDRKVAKAGEEIKGKTAEAELPAKQGATPKSPETDSPGTARDREIRRRTLDKKAAPSSGTPEGGKPKSGKKPVSADDLLSKPYSGGAKAGLSTGGGTGAIGADVKKNGVISGKRSPAERAKQEKLLAQQKKARTGKKIVGGKGAVPKGEQKAPVKAVRTGKGKTALPTHKGTPVKKRGGSSLAGSPDSLAKKATIKKKNELQLAKAENLLKETRAKEAAKAKKLTASEKKSAEALRKAAKKKAVPLKTKGSTPLAKKGTSALKKSGTAIKKKESRKAVAKKAAEQQAKRRIKAQAAERAAKQAAKRAAAKEAEVAAAAAAPEVSVPAAGAVAVILCVVLLIAMFSTLLVAIHNAQQYAGGMYGGTFNGEYLYSLHGHITEYYHADNPTGAAGLVPAYGRVAVDPDKIPYGSVLFIERDDGGVYGWAVAADTGGFTNKAKNGATRHYSGNRIADVWTGGTPWQGKWGMPLGTVYVVQKGNGTATGHEVADYLKAHPEAGTAAGGGVTGKGGNGIRVKNSKGKLYSIYDRRRGNPEGSPIQPQCTTYAWGRYYQMNGVKLPGSIGNAVTWWGDPRTNFRTPNAKLKQYTKRSKTPRPGAIVVLNGPKVAGHVAIVESVSKNGTVVITDSGQTFKQQWNNGWSHKTSYNYKSGRLYGARVLGYLVPR